MTADQPSLAAQVNQDQARRGARKEQAALDARLPVGAQIVGGEGHVTFETDTPVTDGQWDWVLEHNPALDPALHEIDETHPPEFGSWQGYAKNDEGELVTTDLFRYKVKVRTRRPGVRLTQDTVADLVQAVRKRKPVKPPAKTVDGEWLIVCLADLQLGKSDFGGTASAIARVEASIDAVVADIKANPVAGVCLVDMGDMVEGTSCFYDNQSYSVELNMTQQIAVALDLVLAAVDAVMPHAPRVVFGAVPSNHGELRVGKGTVVTDRARDNVDLIIADALARVLSSNDRYAACEVWTPPFDGGDPYVLTLDLDGVMVGFTHGHQVTTPGVGRMAKIEQWWKNHRWSDGRRLPSQTLPTGADCDIMVCAHGHHFATSDATGRLLVHCPAAEDGSEYFETGKGTRSAAGVLTFRTDAGWPMKANHLIIR